MWQVHVRRPYMGSRPPTLWKSAFLLYGTAELSFVQPHLAESFWLHLLNHLAKWARRSQWCWGAGGDWGRDGEPNLQSAGAPVTWFVFDHPHTDHGSVTQGINTGRNAQPILFYSWRFGKTTHFSSQGWHSCECTFLSSIRMLPYSTIVCIWASTQLIVFNLKLIVSTLAPTTVYNWLAISAPLFIQ